MRTRQHLKEEIQHRKLERAARAWNFHSQGTMPLWPVDITILATHSYLDRFKFQPAHKRRECKVIDR